MTPGRDNEVFDPATTPASADLGVVPQTFWRLPGVARSSQCVSTCFLSPNL
ncbi:MAG TPA: AAC(3) family N-acetyltransferase [Gemmatimonadales bacterium]|nr:AAC(3) family N-acetyltransferase [Gemmatimonadales bacterium]